jgi:hypothetical protein
MLKRLTFALVFGLLAACWMLATAPQSAAQDPEKTAQVKAPSLNGTVVSIKGVRVEVTVEGEKPAWVKKGSGIKVKGGLGKIVDVSADTVAFNTKKAPMLKVGEKLVVDKGTVVPAGC